MILYYSLTNPYVWKVMACIMARNIEGQIEKIQISPYESPAALIAENPLSQVPCLVGEDRLFLFDSGVICEYLDTIGEDLPIIPRNGKARWTALRYQALGDGMIRAAMLRRMEGQAPREDAWETFMTRQKLAIERSLDALEAFSPAGGLDIGSITIACALSYLDFRFAYEPWRDSRPQLADWFASMEKQRAITEACPH